jgi:hypothetical protein
LQSQACAALGGTVYAATEGVPGVRSVSNTSGPPPPPALHVNAAVSRSVVYTKVRPHCSTLRFTTTLRSRNTVSVIHGGRTVAAHALGWQKAGFHAYLWCVSRTHTRGMFGLRVYATTGHQSARAVKTVAVRK